MKERLERIKQAVVEGKYRDMEAMVRDALKEGVEPRRIIDDALIAAMDTVGEAFSEGRIFIPEMFVASTAVKTAMTVLEPLLKGGDAVPRGKILMGTVRGDRHDIGKNLVIMMLEGAGFQVVDLGVDVKVEKILRSIEKIEPHILGLSALLTTTMNEMPAIIRKLDAEGLRRSVKVMVGGAPVDAAFAERIGADGHGRDAVEAVQVAKSLIESQAQGAIP